MLCITGRWGVGKTYAWRHYLNEAQEAKSVALSKYSYISLFGRNSLDDVRTSIVENTVESNTAGQLPDIKSFDAIVGKLLSGAKDLTKVATYIPQASGYVASANRALFMMTNKQIVCVDDLERCGKGLDAKDVMGLISGLKEEKQCKVVILLNEEALSGDNKIDFGSQLEKVADTIIKFEPTPAECADIGVEKGLFYTEELKRCLVSLRIINIRVIKKIERLCKRLDALKEYDPRVVDKGIHSIVLAGYAKFQPKEAPPLEFLRTYNQVFDLVGRDRNKSDPNEAFRTLLRSYGYGHMDSFDAVLFDGVERGFFVEDDLKREADQKQKALSLADKHTAFFNAWEDYHGSFDADQDAVLDKMFASVKTDHEAISPINLNDTVVLFKELGRPEQAAEIIKTYVDSRNEEEDFWDLTEGHFGHHVTDVDVISAFAAKYASVCTPFDAEKFIRELPSRGGWDPGEVAAMANVPEDEYVRIFKSLKRDEFKSAVKGALYFKNVSNADGQMQKIVSTAEAALRRIAAESPMNAQRVRNFGISLEKDAKPDAG